MRCQWRAATHEQVGARLPTRRNAHLWRKWWAFMSRNSPTVAPASRHSLTKVRSGPTARTRSRLERRHYVGCFPNTSKGAPHSQRASVTLKSKLSYLRIRILNNCGSTLNSVNVGTPCKTSLAPGLSETSHDWAIITVSQLWYSRKEDA